MFFYKLLENFVAVVYGFTDSDLSSKNYLLILRPQNLLGILKCVGKQCLKHITTVNPVALVHIIGPMYIVSVAYLVY